MWNKSELTPFGEAILKITNPKNAEELEVVVIVVPNGYGCLLGLTTLQQMGLFTINDDKFIAYVKLLWLS